MFFCCITPNLPTPHNFFDLTIPPHLDACHNCPISGAESLKNISYHLHLWAKHKFIFFLSLNRGGILHFNLIHPLPETGHEFHSQATLKIHPIESPTTNCSKSLHNSKIHFDNHFDLPSKSPLTITTNKLSDKLKKLKNPQITTISSSKTTKFHIELLPKKPTNHATFHTIPTSSNHFDLSNSL